MGNRHAVAIAGCGMRIGARDIFSGRGFTAAVAEAKID
jgi:hypothetical protein